MTHNAEDPQNSNNGHDGFVYVIGGTASGGDTAAVQRIDLARGTIKVLASVPVRLSHAAALTVGGRLLVLGGRRAGVAQADIWAFDPGTGQFAVVGRLPYAVSDGAAVGGPDVGYLIGGESSIRLATVVSVTVRP